MFECSNMVVCPLFKCSVKLAFWELNVIQDIERSQLFDMFRGSSIHCFESEIQCRLVNFPSGG
jgi:hypothetical protein